MPDMTWCVCCGMPKVIGVDCRYCVLFVNHTYGPIGPPTGRNWR